MNTQIVRKDLMKPHFQIKKRKYLENITDKD